MTLINQITNQIIKYKKDHGLNQLQLANKIGTRESQVSRWLTGKNKISPAWAELIKQRLGLD